MLFTLSSGVKPVGIVYPQLFSVYMENLSVNLNNVQESDLQNDIVIDLTLFVYELNKSLMLQICRHL